MKKDRVPIPQSPHDLDNIRLWKHPSKPGKYYGYEDFEEWSDRSAEWKHRKPIRWFIIYLYLCVSFLFHLRCHPLWQEYRDVEEKDYARFIHHIWGFDK